MHRAKGMQTVAESVESCLKNWHYILCRVYGGMLAHRLHPRGKTYCTVQYTVPLIYVFPEMKLRGLVPNTCICERFIYSILKGSVCLFGCSKIVKPILGICCINCSQKRAHYNFVSFFGFCVFIICL